MTDKKISQLTVAGSITGPELVPAVQGGVTVSLTANQIAAGYNNSGTSTTTSSATSISLTNTSTRVQNISMTATNRTVTLPDATTMTGASVAPGGPIFTIHNGGSIQFTINNYAGSPKAVIRPGQTAVCFNDSTATTNGDWVIGFTSTTAGSGYPDRVQQGSTLTLNAVSTGTPLACYCITSTQAIVVWQESTVLKGCVVTIAGTSLSQGTTFSIETITCNNASLAYLTSTTLLLLYGSTTTTKAKVITLATSTTITGGTAIVVEAVGNVGMFTTSLTSTTVFAAWGGSTNLRAVVLSVSGTTVTANTIVSGNAYKNTTAICGVNFSVDTWDVTGPRVCNATWTGVAGPVLIAYCNSSTNHLDAQLFTISGTTVTASNTISNISEGQTVNTAATIAACPMYAGKLNSVYSEVLLCWATGSGNLFFRTINNGGAGGTTLSMNSLGHMPVYSTNTGANRQNPAMIFNSWRNNPIVLVVNTFGYGGFINLNRESITGRIEARNISWRNTLYYFNQALPHSTGTFMSCYSPGTWIVLSQSSPTLDIFAGIITVLHGDS